eukprot:4551220-Pleurochrysis_carterae.AAC.3
MKGKHMESKLAQSTNLTQSTPIWADLRDAHTNAPRGDQENSTKEDFQGFQGGAQAEAWQARKAKPHS